MALLASALKNLGIKKGDRVVGMYKGANEPLRKEHESVTLVMTETLSNGPYLTLSLLRVTNILFLLAITPLNQTLRSQE